MSVSSSKKVKTSASTRNVDMIIVRYSAKSRRIMSSRMSGKRALKRLRCDAVASPRLPVVPPRRVPIACSFCSSSFHPRGQVADLDGHAVDAPQQKQSADKEEDVAHPRAEPWRHPSLARHLHAEQREEVIDDHQQNRQHKAGALAAFARRQAQRDADHRQHQAGRGQAQIGDGIRSRSSAL